VKKIVKKLVGIAENDFEIDDIIAEKEYPFSTEIYYKLINKDGKEIYVRKNTMGLVYDELLEHWIRCNYVDKKLKEELKKEKNELDKKWNEYIKDP